VGFKTDTSFLRFLSMGALGTKGFMTYLRNLGYRPIELERYCASNKIWTTKVKRLRLPDVICALTGIRIEVRAKSDLKIRMSDAPANPDRHWNTGLRNDDLCAFIRCAEVDGSFQVSATPSIFTVSNLMAAVETSKLGPPKSASEGAERDREWPSTVPGQNGAVAEVSAEKIVIQFDAGRRQTYQLRGKVPYVAQGDRVVGEETIIAGTVPAITRLQPVNAPTWNPAADVAAANPVDRYAAAKVLPFSTVNIAQSVQLLEQAMQHEQEPRVALEQAGSAARMGSNAGFEYISNLIWTPGSREDLRMESVFILTEIATPEAATELRRIAAAQELSQTELREAAIWGLGKAGAKAYQDVLPYISDAKEDVALHAIAALGADVNADQIDQLIELLLNADLKTRAAACAALKAISSTLVAEHLVAAAAQASPDNTAWIVATLGGMPLDIVRAVLQGHELLETVMPLLLLHPHENWIEHKSIAERLDFLMMQNVN